MKKAVLTWFLAGALLLYLVGCSGSTTWRLHAVTMTGVEMTVDEFSQLIGVDVSAMEIYLGGGGKALLSAIDPESGNILDIEGGWEKTDEGYRVTDESGDVFELIRQRGSLLVMELGLVRFTYIQVDG